jgi:anti-anti-sigma factor
MNVVDQLVLSEDGGFPVARLSGEIDASNAIEIETELTYAVSNAAAGLIIDLTEVSFLDSSGMRFLFDLAVRLERRQQELRLVLPQTSHLHRALCLLQMPVMIPIFEDVASAAA